MRVKLATYLALIALFAVPALAQMTDSDTAADADAEVTETNKVVKPPKDLFTNSVGMVMTKVGSYWAGEYEVTQAQYKKLTGSNPSACAGDDRPVDSISYGDAVAFCEKLTEKEIKRKKLPEGYMYALPTEEQWSSLVGDASIPNAVTSIHMLGTRSCSESVGSKAPNSLGLYDVLGNVMEFVQWDQVHNYRVLKGGCWQDQTEINLRPAFRYYTTPTERKNTFGFRCLLLPPANAQQ